MQETKVQTLGREDPLETRMATHFLPGESRLQNDHVGRDTWFFNFELLHRGGVQSAVAGDSFRWTARISAAGVCVFILPRAPPLQAAA